MDASESGVHSFLYAINQSVWGPPVLLLILFTGFYFSMHTGFFQLTGAGIWFRSALGSLFHRKRAADTVKAGSVTPFQALTAALAGTVGIGNIAGVATAIAAGGPGAVFWMWASALLNMMTSFAENVLGHLYSHKSGNSRLGGPMYYMTDGLHMKWLASAYSLFCLLACFGVGNMVQANSIAVALSETADISPALTGLLLASLTAVVILGGLRRIVQVTEKIIPFMSGLYILCCIIIIISNASQIAPALELIFEEAFSLRSAGSGLMGFTIIKSMRYGISHGIFTNEAGLGSAVIANSAADIKTPARQGMLGMFEVFFDTLVICTMTALAILCSGAVPGGKTGAALTLSAFSLQFGGAGQLVLSFCIILFAFSTILGWSYYGRVSLFYLSGDKYLRVFQYVFIVCIFCGCIIHVGLVWEISDTCNGLMAVPNLIALLLLSKQVLHVAKDLPLHRRKKND